MNDTNDTLLSGFCGGVPLWDEDLLLNSSYPKFTQCFMDTALVLVPCGALWLMTPFYLIYLSRLSRNSAYAHPSIPINKLNGFRTFLTIALAVLSAMRLAYDAGGYDVTTAKYVAGGVYIATFILVGILMQIQRAHGFLTSGPIFVTFTLLVIAGVIPIYTGFEEKAYDTDSYEFDLTCAFFGIVLLEYLLLFWADSGAPRGYRAMSAGTRPECPEVNASFPSQLTFMWITSLIRLGYSRDLTEDDVPVLNPRDQSSTVLPEFEAVWNKEMRQCKAINRAKFRTSSTDSSGSVGFVRSTEDIFTANEKTRLLTNATNVPIQPAKDLEKYLKRPSLTKVLGKTFGWYILLSQFMKLISDGLMFVPPILIRQLLSYTTHREDRQEWIGYVLASSFFVVSAFRTIIYQYHFHVSMTLGTRMKNAVICAVYKKSLTISNEAKRERTIGEIVNLMSVDCQKIQDVMGYIYMVWSMPLQLVIAMVMLYGTLGPASLVGLGVLLLLMPINGVVAWKQRTYQWALMRIKDNRIRIMNEVLNGMKVLKLYAWEESFMSKINCIREKELTVLKKQTYLSAFSTFIWSCAPYAVQLASFGAYTVISDTGYLDAATAFVSISLFNILNMPMGALPMVIPMLIQANVSLGRICKFLSSEDLDPNVVRKDPNCDSAVKIQNGTFTWDKQMPTPTLSGINLSIKPGSLTAIVGTVGAGKSSLLAAMLGEMKKIKGEVTLKDRLAYVPQEAWIQNNTVKDNILFGNGHSSSRYKTVLTACALDADLAILPGGDNTEIGEKGINLSGGQKQRVSLARAVYSDADTYLLDDPLSAVDAHVGKHIFSEVISHKGILKNKTRILVTHGIHWLPMVDHIIVLNQGRISEEGTYDELISHEGAFAHFLQEFFRNEADTDVDEQEEEEDEEIGTIKDKILQRLESVTSETDFTSGDEGAKGQGESIIRQKLRQRQKSVEPQKSLDRQKSLTRQKSLNRQATVDESSKPQKPEGSKLIEQEKSESGRVSWAVFLTYIKAVGVIVFLFMSLVYTGYQVAATYSAIWLSMWTDDPLLNNVSQAGTHEYNNRNAQYLLGYGLFGLAQGLCILSFALIAARRMVLAAGKLHADMLDNVFRSPMSFYDTTPMGRVLNRFSADIDKVDVNIPQTVRSFYQCLFRVVGTVVTVTYSTPIFLAAVVPLSILYFFIQRFYVPTSRQLRRIESTTRSPIYVHFSESVTGASSIRAYGVEDRFIALSRFKTDTNLSFYFAQLVSNRWLGWCLEMIGNLIVLFAALFAVLAKNLSSGLVGLSVSYSQTMTGALNFMVRTMSELETNIVAVERIKEYSETPTEAAWVNPYNKPGDGWPDQGEIQFYNYQTRYRPGLELVLRGVNCNIKSGEKVGIVGRTGAGKSSLTLALFRLIESADGNILIDGVPIANLGLHDLRSRLTILPQDPVIFSGTLRMNLDPFDEYRDTDIWRALEHAHLKDFVAGLPGDINYECGEGGSNLSVGQRQLLCLARTLVRQTRILILDEATAAVDLETDELIQRTIRTQFSHCTVLAIAHRLNTIMDYDKKALVPFPPEWVETSNGAFLFFDRIMVLDQGLVAEYDSPAMLLANKDSIFYGMASNSGLV